jgi:hypothetical protein
MPHARADLRFSLIDLDDLTALAAALWPAVPTLAPTQPRAGVIPAATSAAAPLRGLDVDIGLRGARIIGSGLPPLDDVAAALRFKGGVLALDPMTFGVAGGQVTVGLTVDPASSASAFALDADIRRVDLARLVGPTALPPYAKEAHGIAGGFAHVRSAGASRHDLLDHMEGEAGVFAENGAIGPALQHLLASDVLAALGLDGGPQAAAVDCMISRFSLKSGVATASTLLLDTPGMALSGQGKVNFGANTIYVDITPHHKQVTPSTTSTPVEVRGSYADAIIRPGTASIAERFAAAVEPALSPPPPALQPLADAALGENNSCRSAFAVPEDEDIAVGSSVPPKKPRP